MATATATDYQSGTTRSYGEVEVEVIADIPEWWILAWVPINAINIDQSYQRPLNQDFAHRIKSEHDAKVEDPPLLGARPSGALYAISGQHRIAAAHLRGDEMVICRIVQEVGRSSEADMRLKGNVALAESSVQKFKAKVAAEQPEALAIVAVCESFGTHINTAPQMNAGLNCVAALEKLYRIDEGILLTRTFEVVRDAWGKVEGKQASSTILTGIAWFLRVHGADTFDRNRLIEKMQQHGHIVLVRRAQNLNAIQGGSLWLNFYRALVEAYNEQLGDRNKLEAETGGWSKARIGGTGSSPGKSWE